TGEISTAFYVIYFDYGKHRVYGIGAEYKFKTQDDEKILFGDKHKGYQIVINIGNPEKPQYMTSQEKWIRKILDMKWRKTQEAMEKFCSIPEKKRTFPMNTISDGVWLQASTGRKDWTDAVKPMYDYPKQK